ncbi:NAD(P)-binding domain-containing protein [Flavobacteriaceae bacterium]|nr:NAD(P)-binding domain-containing protein [Flavobacteriaceae bacterium]
MRIVYNIEPNHYSEIAIENWVKTGYKYVNGSYESFKNYKHLNSVEILIVRLKNKINADLISCFKNLKIVISATTGLNHIDLQILKSKKIQLISLKGHENFLKQIPSTAELTFSLILNLMKNVTQSIESVKSGNWNRENFKGFQLFNKKIGIIGLGRIGTMVARYAKAFGMKIFYYDPYVENNSFNKVDNVLELVSKVDIITIHIDYNVNNKKFIDKNIISHFKNDIYIINTSRGEIWDEKEIVKMLKKGIIKGLAVDVLSDETGDLKANPIWNERFNPKVLLTPHIGGASFDAMWQCELFVQNLIIKK